MPPRKIEAYCESIRMKIIGKQCGKTERTGLTRGAGDRTRSDYASSLLYATQWRHL
jgi:hypothetical protein